jgi:hypothetical protein
MSLSNRYACLICCELKNKKQQETQRTQRRTSLCFSVYGLQTENLKLRTAITHAKKSLCSPCLRCKLKKTNNVTTCCVLITALTAIIASAPNLITACCI